MEKYVYSPSVNAFYPLSLQSHYEQFESWPQDGNEVDEPIFVIYSGAPPKGTIRGSTIDGMPTWIDLPQPTQEEIIDAAERNKKSLLLDADSITADWRTELSLGEISDADKAKLSAWMAYKREVKAVEASNPVWPKPPEM